MGLTDFCDLYHAGQGIESCEDQITRIDTQDVPVVSYVIAAWSEPKEWCVAEFGINEWLEPEHIGIVSAGPCPASTTVTVPTTGWPGPYEDIVLIAEEIPWTGNLEPFCWLLSYDHFRNSEQTLIQLTPHPESGFAGTHNRSQHRKPLPPFASAAWGSTRTGSTAVPRLRSPVCPKPTVAPLPVRLPGRP